VGDLNILLFIASSLIAPLACHPEVAFKCCHRAMDSISIGQLKRLLQISPTRPSLTLAEAKRSSILAKKMILLADLLSPVLDAFEQLNIFNSFLYCILLKQCAQSVNDGSIKKRAINFP